jgi:hypothetical protein
VSLAKGGLGKALGAESDQETLGMGKGETGCGHGILGLNLGSVAYSEVNEKRESENGYAHCADAVP